ncbi:MAG TPA: 50S ribosomal protein L25/general stress protein Ctc [Thermohalobaculum sp.]|nr:50S ribosomal protein L25/general stress protein Ctc [Thermohalobaculum sp.]
MADMPIIEAHAREGTGKGAARAARRAGFVPAVVYGGNKDPKSVNIRHNVLLKALKQGRFLSTLVKIDVEGEQTTVICRDVQRDVVRDLPIHADFLRLSERSMINLFIPVVFTGEEECPGLRAGGVLTVVRNEVELRVRAGDIPEQITVDLSGFEIGDTLHISQADVPAGAKPTIGRDFVIANIQPPSSLASQEDEEEAEAAEAEAAEAEGEETAEREEAPAEGEGAKE